MITDSDVGRTVTHQLHGYGMITGVDEAARLVHVFFLRTGQQSVHPSSLTVHPEMTEEELEEGMSNEYHPSNPFPDGSRHPWRC